MTTNAQIRIKELIERLSRTSASGEWLEDLNPTQWAALSYIERANRFSRSPSQVSDFMATTRGTVSQTLKALSRKGLISEIRSDQDKRSISYSISDTGKALLQKTSVIEEAVSLLSDDEIKPLLSGLEALVRNALKRRGGRAFGVCKTCKHFCQNPTGGFCSLLKESLNFEEVKQICHEHS